MTRTVPPSSEPEAQTSTAAKDVAPAVALHTGTSNVRALLTSNLRQSGIYIAFVAIIALFTVLTDGTLLSPGNVTNIVLQYSYILILAIGMVIVIIAGHIDLSVGSVVALTGATSAVLVIRQGMPWWAGVLAALAVGMAVGAWQGFWVATSVSRRSSSRSPACCSSAAWRRRCSTTSPCRRSRTRTPRSPTAS